MADNSDGEDKKRDYEVGYGKPPKRTQFQPGQSGNPKGRRKGSGNFNGYVQHALSERISFTQDGRRQNITKLQLIATQLVNSAVKGNLKSIEFLLRLMDLMGTATDSSGHSQALSESMRHKLLEFFADAGKDTSGNDNGQ